MKKITQLVTLALILTFALTAIAETKSIEGFSSSDAGKFPKGWRTRPGQGDAADQVYKVKQEGDAKYLAADDETGASAQIFRLAHWDTEKYPFFKWSWRARKLPAGANETIPEKNDSACGIYISFGMVRSKAIKYVWSTTAPKGTVYKKNDDMYIIVKETGGAGRWASESVNIVEDATKVFGKMPDKVLSGVAILTDGNATGTPAACDYDNIGYGSEQ